MTQHHDPNRVVPENIEAESALLGAILVNNAAFDAVNRLLEPQHFFEPLHQHVYEAIGQMLAAGRSATPVTLKNNLPASVEGLKVNGEEASTMAYLAHLCANAVTVINAPDYAAAVYDAWVARQRNSFGMKRDNPRPISMDLFGGDPAKTPFDAIFYLYRFIKFLEERKAIASSDSDWKKINQVFPSAVREEGIDIAEIGAIKVRFGSVAIKQRLVFEARLTRYKSDRAPVEQESLGI